MNKINIEQKIADLKNKIDEFNNLSNLDKIKNVENLNIIIKEKEEYLNYIDYQKKKIQSKETYLLNEEINDQNFIKLIERINQIKKIIDENNLNFDEIIELIEEFKGIKYFINNYLQEKKMKITYIQ